MRNTRKGFTLVELLIVVAILATLTAAMTVSVSGSTAKAKAATIASNVDAFVNAARMYCADNTDGDISSAKTDDVIGAYIGKWLDLKNGSSVKYEAVDLEKLATNSKWTQDKTWCVKVTIEDNDKKILSQHWKRFLVSGNTKIVRHQLYQQAHSISDYGTVK